MPPPRGAGWLLVVRIGAGGRGAAPSVSACYDDGAGWPPPNRPLMKLSPDDVGRLATGTP